MLVFTSPIGRVVATSGGRKTMSSSSSPQELCLCVYHWRSPVCESLIPKNTKNGFKAAAGDTSFDECEWWRRSVT